MADVSGGIRLKKKPHFRAWFANNRRSPMRKLNTAFTKSLMSGLKKRQTYVSKFKNPPAFSAKAEGTFWQGKFRYAIERDDEPAESAHLSAWELVNMARVQKAIFSPNFVAKTNRDNLRTVRGQGKMIGVNNKAARIITPRYQIPRLNRIILRDIKKHVKGAGVTMSVQFDPFEQYKSPGDG